MANRKGLGAIGFLILFGFLIFMWPFVFAPLLNLAGEAAIANGTTGVSGFLWANLNLLMFLCLFLVAAVYIRLGGQS